MELAIPHLRILDYVRAVAFYADAWSERLRQRGVPFERELEARSTCTCLQDRRRPRCWRS